MEANLIKKVDIEKYKELFAYEMTEVLVNLKGEFAEFAAQNNGLSEAEAASLADKLQLPEMKRAEVTLSEYQVNIKTSVPALPKVNPIIAQTAVPLKVKIPQQIQKTVLSKVRMVSNSISIPESMLPTEYRSVTILKSTTSQRIELIDTVKNWMWKSPALNSRNDFILIELPKKLKAVQYPGKFMPKINSNVVNIPVFPTVCWAPVKSIQTVSRIINCILTVNIPDRSNMHILYNSLPQKPPIYLPDMSIPAKSVIPEIERKKNPVAVLSGLTLPTFRTNNTIGHRTIAIKNIPDIAVNWTYSPVSIQRANTMDDGFKVSVTKIPDSRPAISVPSLDNLSITVPDTSPVNVEIQKKIKMKHLPDSAISEMYRFNPFDIKIKLSGILKDSVMSIENSGSKQSGF